MSLIDGNNTFVPRWRKEIVSCFVIGCANTDTTVTKVMSGMTDIFELKPTHSEEIPLCSGHYMKWYKHKPKSYTSGPAQA